MLDGAQPACVCRAGAAEWLAPLPLLPLSSSSLQVIAEPLDTGRLWDRAPYIAEFVEDLPVGAYLHCKAHHCLQAAKPAAIV